MSLHRTVVMPCTSVAERAAGKREKPRKAWPSVVVAARPTVGVQTFGYRSVSRHGASDSLSGLRKRLSSRSMSWISYAFDNCAMIRQRNGEKNDGMAASSTRQRRPGAGTDGGVTRGQDSKLGS